MANRQSRSSRSVGTATVRQPARGPSNTSHQNGTIECGASPSLTCFAMEEIDPLGFAPFPGRARYRSVLACRREEGTGDTFPGSDIMPEVKRAGCPIAGENGGFFSRNWIHGDSPVQSRRDRETCYESHVAYRFTAATSEG